MYVIANNGKYLPWLETNKLYTGVAAEKNWMKANSLF